MSLQAAMTNVSCAVEVFLATALLHREQPAREDFTIQEIVSRAARENVTGEMRQGVSVHASQHCVANREPNPAKQRMLFATGKHTRRLLLPTDAVHPDRTGKIFPDPGELPERYLPLLEWAKVRYESAGSFSKKSNVSPANHPPDEGGNPATTGRWLEALFELQGLGKEHLEGTAPDEFVRQLREGWE